VSVRQAAVVACVLSLLLFAYAWRYEGIWANLLFVMSATLLQAAVLVALTRRLLFASVFIGALVGIVIAAATAKRHMMDMVLHAYDIFFYFSSWSTVSYLWSDHRIYVLQLLGAFALTALAAAAAWRMDASRIARVPALAAAVVLAGLTMLGAEMKGERRHTQFYWEDLFLTSFYASWAETAETLWRGTLLEAAAHQSAKPFALSNRCDLVHKPPHVILVHEESIVPPSVLPGLDYDRSVDRMFKSFDGKMHRMRVETYGGASWLTEFSILAGVSTQSFGGMRQFVQSLMAGKIRDTLPESLARCGYRNVVFYPMMRNFVSNAKFFTAVGMPEILDMKDQGAKSVNERDKFYFNNALSLMEKHFKSSSRPLFTFIETMSAHSPYTYKFEESVEVPGGGPGTHPEMHEYLRRLSMSHMDLAAFEAEVTKRFPDERFLIVHYGDHHPMATRVVLGQSVDLDAEDVVLTPDSIGYITYYAVKGIRYQPPPLPAVETLDVPYLGSVILSSAGLPLSDAMQERQRLMQVCAGAYQGCANKEQILSFHRRLIDSGIVDAR
jgi:phosphoglycerol transferase MdoB-like AlkP superfamily enzyme